MSRFKINENGFWENESGVGHVHDTRLSEELIKFLKEKDLENVVDFGCGMGDYARKIINSNILCEAYDGNPNTELLTKGLGKVLDLSTEFDLNKKFDCVISLEVGEHIPKYHEQTFINNICKHTNKFLIISWAVEGQGGDGHVNCQNNEYIIDEITKKGFSYDEKNTTRLRSSVSNATWFKNTIMIFEKNI